MAMMTHANNAKRNGALLLEVVVALTIMVGAMGLLGAQLVHGLRMTGKMDELTRAAELGDRILALIELDPAVQEQIEAQIQNEEEIDGEFGDAYPGWFWRTELVPVEEITGVTEVHVQILHAEGEEQRPSIDEANVVYQVVLLKAAPGRIDLVEDFGLDEDQAAEFASLIPLEGFDPNNIDVQALVAYATENPEALLEMLPSLLPLLQQFAGAGFAPGGQQFNPDQLGDLAGQFGNGEIDPAQLEELLRLGVELGGQGVAPPAGGAPRGRGGEGIVGVTRPGGGRGGAQGGQGGQGGAQSNMTIEDLIRLRDELRQQQGGG